MISIDNEKIKVLGPKYKIMGELSLLIHDLLREDILNEKEVKRCVEDALKDDETIRKEAMSKIKRIADLMNCEDNAQDALEEFHRIFGDLDDN